VKDLETQGDAGATKEAKGDAASVPVDAVAAEATEGASSARTKDDGAGSDEGGAYRTRSSREKQPLPRGRRIFKTLYWVSWFVIVPAALAEIFREVVTPASGVVPQGSFAWLQSIVADQPVPVLIVAFTLFEMALWTARHHLPLSKFAHPPARADVPEPMRGPFERARSLLEEAEAIYHKNERAIVRDLTAKEREKLRVDLESLESAMEAVPFEEERFVDALVKADGEVDVRLGRWRKSEVREYLESILVAIAVAMALRTFVVEAFKIPSGSMIPTLQVGDHIFVNKFSYGPAVPWTHSRVWTKMPPDRGDVMVFAFPEHPEQDFIKRVIAIPGDKLEARSGHPILNGWEVPSCYVGIYSYNEIDSPLPRHEGDLYVEFLEDEAYLTLYDHAAGGFPEYQGPFFVKPGEVYVMGDNRNNSHDSRMWWGGQGGGVPFENIKGRALFVWLSVSESGMDVTRMGAPVMGRPRLPTAMKSLEQPLDKCLRERPPLDKTTPPRAK
jgi:signal peptidase I